MIEEFASRVFALLPWWQAIIAAIALTIILSIGKRAIGDILSAKVPPYQPVDNAPPSDGSAPGDVHDAQPGEVPPPPGYEDGGGG